MNTKVNGLVKKRISFFVARYSRSGVPLAQIRLAKAFHRRGFEVAIVFGYVPEGLDVPVIDGIAITNLCSPRTYKLLKPIISHLKNYRPEVVFSAEDHLNAIVTLALLLVGSKAKLSVSSRVTPFDTYSNIILSKRWVLKKISVPLRARANALVCVSEDMVLQYRSIFGPSKYQCIYNVILDAETQEKMLRPVEDTWLADDTIPVVITAGRLEPEKGFFDLILAMKALTRTKAARLLILGEGSLEQELKELINREGLADSVRLLGFQDNPLKYFSRAKVFVLSSYVEGLPNVLVEAMTCGCTVVSTDCPTGPREVLNNGQYGYLVPMHNPAAMAVAIQKALESPIPETLMKEAVKPFMEGVVIAKHLKVLGLNYSPDGEQLNDRLKICVAVSSYTRTGVPLAQLRLARALAEKGHEVDFLIGGIDPQTPHIQLPKIAGVTVTLLAQSKVRKMIFPLYSYLRNARPDVVFSAEDHFNGAFLVAAILTGSKAKFSVSSRVPPSDSYSNTMFSKRWVKKQLMRAVMWRADVMTCVSKDMVYDYRHYFGGSAPHIGVYNIIVDKPSLQAMNEPLDDPWFNDRSSPLLVAAGTLTTRKGYADLVRAMHELSKTHQARLVILGEGPLRKELQQLIDALGLSDNVRLHGIVDNPLKYYARSDIFVLSSYAEGLPNVLVEAMMCGCTPVATDCRTGPREVIQEGRYGYLVPVGDPVALAAGIASAIDRPIAADLLAEAIEPFFEDAVIHRHFEVLGLSAPKPVAVNEYA